MVAFLASQLRIESDAYGECRRDEPVRSILATYNRICEFVLCTTTTAVLQDR
jgi:hypothetical protein